MASSCSPKKRKGASVHKRGELIHGKGERAPRKIIEGFCQTSATAQLEDLNGVVLSHGGRDDDVSGRRNKDVISAAQQLACQRVSGRLGDCARARSAGIVSGLVVGDSVTPLKSNGGSLSLPPKLSLALLLKMERDAL